ncbi:hypothetical protein CPC08DRAFT_515731 [Agrocybe pediades]|nr:hypothetical protein CPC08DRAFT_515731 [Agrocybe pediades]
MATQTDESSRSTTPPTTLSWKSSETSTQPRTCGCIAFSRFQSSCSSGLTIICILRCGRLEDFDAFNAKVFSNVFRTYSERITSLKIGLIQPLRAKTLLFKRCFSHRPFCEVLIILIKLRRWIMLTKHGRLVPKLKPRAGTPPVDSKFKLEDRMHP